MEQGAALSCREIGAMKRPQEPTAAFAGQPGQAYLDRMKEPVISCSPDIMGGVAVFSGTRVPLQTLLDYLEAGESIDDFLAGFPMVPRSQVIAFLEQAKDRLIDAAS